MNIYTNTKFIGFQPTGTAAIVVALNERDATALLNLELKELGLEPTAKVEDMKFVAVNSQPKATILCDGDY